MNLGKRDRTRASLFGNDSGNSREEEVFDPETAERDNDRNIDHMAERAAMLKQITMDIHKEAETHNQLLDGMGNAMEGARTLLEGTVGRFAKVFENKTQQSVFKVAGVFVVIMLILYYGFK
mmetsp:Transcript_6705/g.7693  ORF Transcript_6705/g.7693 Transcript_6705/m.7693 type:complete len:121 (+) Transcript_6705:261-623(+)|eukprot:CAMPEP_0197846878 /NCGR_PEP_ID=MMETSP1438-20131217/4693_1 /TAXON_ID=1461541 /ORGANISM="Pterosperma sp., Strain CCMP1384" /LENGTH=120 /DNA_ID=CAMNT_0043458657 /DNA_START=257 /DNA_END=619 /DNA_ORIENTATION=-